MTQSLIDSFTATFNVLEAIKPERFYLYLTTNGYYLDKKMAKELAKFKVSRVSVSIDSMNEETHDSFIGKKGAWERAINDFSKKKSLDINVIEDRFAEIIT